jgi:hypothetical protein
LINWTPSTNQIRLWWVFLHVILGAYLFFVMLTTPLWTSPEYSERDLHAVLSYFIFCHMASLRKG